jgi:hypothetical protein
MKDGEWGCWLGSVIEFRGSCTRLMLRMNSDMRISLEIVIISIRSSEMKRRDARKDLQVCKMTTRDGLSAG